MISVTKAKRLKINLIIATVCFSSLFLYSDTNAQSKSIFGYVTDLYSGKPIEDAIIMLLSVYNDVEAVRVTDSLGLFLINTSKIDAFYIKTQKLGYVDIETGPFNFTEKDTFNIIIQLEPDPVTLDEVFVVSEKIDEELEIAGFYRRRNQGLGKFLTSIDFENTSPPDIRTVFRMIPGAVVTEWGIYSGRYISGSKFLNGGGNRPTICIDGVIMQDDPTMTDEQYFSFLHSPAENVKAIEFYKSSIDAPMHLGGGWRPGGVIVIWTKN